MLLWSHQSSAGDLFLLRFGEALQPLTWLTGPQMAWPCIHLCGHLLCHMALPGRPASWAFSVSFPRLDPSCCHPRRAVSPPSPAWYSFLSPCSSVLLSGEPPSSLKFLSLSLRRVLVAAQAFLWLWWAGAAHCGGFSSCGPRAPRALEGPCWPLVGAGVQSPAAERRLHGAGAGWAAPRHVGSSWTGMEPLFPTLVGGLFITEPPGKPKPEV